ncbi:JAB domain-containing protein [Altibacter sp. HG106]|uniref:JAB domain-containing protein n=1 Tax=Altibacter sp. HG106 TaxID=3023937 RepID=UPI002350D7D7|nr:JAB domain-containing protein [Altibacter sp. HG106]MDC7994466.1 JAB domain-containing protein [Altibacter sp. HG106]
MEIPQIQEIEIVYRNPIAKIDRQKITSSLDASEIFRKYIGNKLDYQEIFCLMPLNNSNEVLGIIEISRGGATGTIVDVKQVFQKLLKCNAIGFLMAHNHPSGNTRPSEADKKLTKKIKEAANFLDITLLDHLIITTESYYSFADECIL